MHDSVLRIQRKSHMELWNEVASTMGRLSLPLAQISCLGIGLTTVTLHSS